LLLAGQFKQVTTRPQYRRRTASCRLRAILPRRRPPGEPDDLRIRCHGNRRLSPEQNAEAGKCAADLRDEAIQRIAPAMERIKKRSPTS